MIGEAFALSTSLFSFDRAQYHYKITLNFCSVLRQPLHG